MEVRYLEQADEDLAYWIKTGNKAIIKKNAELTRAILEDAYQGIGKPEALKYELSGKWFRRITQEHRYFICYFSKRTLLKNKTTKNDQRTTKSSLTFGKP